MNERRINVGSHVMFCDSCDWYTEYIGESAAVNRCMQCGKTRLGYVHMADSERDKLMGGTLNMGGLSKKAREVLEKHRDRFNAPLSESTP